MLASGAWATGCTVGTNVGTTSANGRVAALIPWMPSTPYGVLRGKA